MKARFMNFKRFGLALFSSFSLSCFASYSVTEMSLEEKVGQLLMVQFHGEEANQDAQTLIQKTKVGGIIYYNWCNGLHSPEQIQALSASLQTLTGSNPHPIPLLIAADQEGGVVARLNHGFTKFPGNKALGETSNPILAKEAALATGIELQAVGINMNLAPVADINSNPRNPVIGVRSFGDCPETVLLFAEQSLKGYKEADTIATLKHFPGHGDTAIDSHEDLPIVHKSKEALEQMELLPFARLSHSADAIMTAHILVPALDKENCSTLSEKTLHYLRETLGFQGVIVSDSLVMSGVLKKCQTVDEAAIQALKAGCDLLILGGKLISGEQAGFELKVPDIERIHRSLVKAVKEGRISESRLNQAVEKILHLKDRYLCIKNDTNRSIDLKKTVDTAPHRALAQKIASLALKVNPNDLGSTASLTKKNVVIFAPQLLRSILEQTTLLKIGKSTDLWCFSNLNPSEEEIEAARQEARRADVLCICAYNAWKNPSQIKLIQSLLGMGKQTILLVTRDPLDASLFPEAPLIFTTFSPTPPSIQSVCYQLGIAKQ
jgi:beta-N-acetylhexosaminidase